MNDQTTSFCRASYFHLTNICSFHCYVSGNAFATLVDSFTTSCCYACVSSWTLHHFCALLTGFLFPGESSWCDCVCVQGCAQNSYFFFFFVKHFYLTDMHGVYIYVNMVHTVTLQSARDYIWKNICSYITIEYLSTK